jgi:cleavage stimulation factor subunit 3
VAIWTRWAEQEMAAGNIAALKSIFSRCLLDCPHVALWFVYIRFIKKVGGGGAVGGCAWEGVAVLGGGGDQGGCW